MSPDENFQFINEYIAYMEPAIKENSGFIDQFINGKIIALFPKNADDAVLAGVALLEALNNFNKIRTERNQKPLRIGLGVGISTGRLLMGAIGGKYQLETSVIGRVVTIAARMEELTKEYDSHMLISGEAYQAIKDLKRIQYRFIGKTLVKDGQEVDIWEIYSGDPKELRNAKTAIARHYEQAINLYYKRQYDEALRLFQRCFEKLPTDKVIKNYIEKCQKAIDKKGYTK
jgi:class 3 adenylate cyclase